MTVEVSDGATVVELLSQLGIPLEKIGMVSLDGRLAGKPATLRPGMMVKVFHPIFGG
jgi:sulfur carrier protein ThiS